MYQYHRSLELEFHVKSLYAGAPDNDELNP